MGDTTREDAAVPADLASTQVSTTRETADLPAATDAPGLSAPANLVATLERRFTLVRFLGGGGEGNLLLVTDADGVRFVVKQYAHGWQANEDVLDRLIAAHTGHSRESWAGDPRFRSVLWIEEWGVDPSWRMFYEVQEFLPIGQLEALDVWPVAGLVRALSDAVDAFHDVVGAHRDVKPANLLIRSADGPVLVLADVGLARVVGDASKRYSRRDGTAAYQAPEAAQGEVSQAGDWWSVGMIVAEAALGAHPMARPDGSLPDDRQIHSELAQRDVPRLESVADERVRLLCRGLLTRDADLRWGARQVRDWLAGASPATSFGADARQVDASEPARRIRTVRLAGAEYTTAASLADAFAGDPQRAGTVLFEQKDAVLREDLRLMLRSAGLHEAQSLVDSHRSGPWEATFLRLLVEMDPELPPVLGGQPMTPAAVSRVAIDVVGGGGGTPEQLRVLDWVLRHDLWRIWRNQPEMGGAAAAAEELLTNTPALEAALRSAGWLPSGGNAWPRLVVAAGGAVVWRGQAIGGSDRELLGPDIARAYWAHAGPVLSAWEVLAAVAPQESDASIRNQLADLHSQPEQSWWIRLAKSQGLPEALVAFLSQPLARQGQSALDAHGLEMRRAEQMRVRMEHKVATQSHTELIATTRRRKRQLTWGVVYRTAMLGAKWRDVEGDLWWLWMRYVVALAICAAAAGMLQALTQVDFLPPFIALVVIAFVGGAVYLIAEARDEWEELDRALADSHRRCSTLTAELDG